MTAIRPDDPTPVSTPQNTLTTPAPLTVLQVITKGEIGGAQTHVRTLCEALGQAVTFHAAIGGTEPQPPLDQALRAQGVAVHRVPSLSNSLAPWRLYRAVRELIVILHAVHPQLLHAHSSAAGVAARIAGYLTRTPVVYTVHGFAFKPGAPPLRRLLAWVSECLCAPLTSQLICVSTHELQWARRLPLPRDRCSVIPNALEDTSHRAAPATTPMNVVMVARMAPPKRADLLILALAELRDQQGQEVPATLVGDGPDLPLLRTQAQGLGLQQLRWAGSRSDVPQLLAQHAVFVLLSNHEGMPISIIEAMRAGMAIVASDLPGIRELLPTANHGLCVSNQVTAITAALQQLLQNSNIRENLGHTARSQYELAHTPERMALAVLDVYRHIAA